MRGNWCPRGRPNRGRPNRGRQTGLACQRAPGCACGPRMCQGARCVRGGISRYSVIVKPIDAPLYEIKANLFRALAHPVRIRVLEQLVAAGADASGAGEVTVAELLSDLGGSPSHLSGHLAVLRQHGVVTSRRVGSHVRYRTTHPAVVDLLASARRFLLDSLAAKRGQLSAAAALPPLGTPTR